jgi:hypothetical protein
LSIVESSPGSKDIFGQVSDVGGETSAEQRSNERDQAEVEVEVEDERSGKALGK